MNNQKILNLIDSTQRQVDRMRSPESINRMLLQTLDGIKRLCLAEEQPDTKSEPRYIPNQPIWYATDWTFRPGRHKALFLKYNRKTVKILVMIDGIAHYRQNVDISMISPRNEDELQKGTVQG